MQKFVKTLVAAVVVWVCAGQALAAPVHEFIDNNANSNGAAAEFLDNPRMNELALLGLGLLGLVAVRKRRVR